MTEKERGVLVAIEIFNIKCRQLARTRNPNIYVAGQEELFSGWFEDGITSEITHFGKNDHPDCVIRGVGFELKSKKGNGQIQFNSTIPTGRFNHKGQEGECYYAIARYVEDRQFGQLVDFTICYGDYFNHDHDWAHAHMNQQEGHFGNYGDGVVRYRKMYSFPTPTRDVPGISLILDVPHGEQLNSNIFLEREIIRENVTTNQEFTFYVYRSRLLLN